MSRSRRLAALLTVAGALAAAPLFVSPAVAEDGPHVSEAWYDPSHSRASAVEVPGVLLVGQAETTDDGARVTILGAAGEDLLVREGNAGGGEWGGPLAAAGTLVDTINAETCGEQDPCIVLLPSNATTIQRQYGQTNDAWSAVLSVRSGEDGITLLPTEAHTEAVVFGDCRGSAAATSATGAGALGELASALNDLFGAESDGSDRWEWCYAPER